ncbi:MAG: hypothetical protein Q8P82_01675 [bacterium]|nr:hypothetical protein [bacterium]
MKPKVLIVDADHEMMWLHWLTLVIPTGFDVVTFRSSTEALAALHDGDTYALAVIGSEIRGHLHALELAALIGRIMPQLPIIFMPWAVTETYRAVCAPYGVKFVTKRMAFAEYEHAVRRLLHDTRRQISLAA